MAERLLLGRYHALEVQAVDADFYRRNSRSVLAQLFPAIHYHWRGWRDGLDPNPYFRTRWYLDQNADVRRQGANPLLHYLRFGRQEGRYPRPVVETERDQPKPFVVSLTDGSRSWWKGPPPAAISALAADARALLEGDTPQGQTPQWSRSIDHAEARFCRFDPDQKVWTVTGHDPQLSVAVGAAAGFMRLRVAIDYHDIRRAIADEAVFQLFIDEGHGFTPQSVLTYPIADGRLEIDDLLLLVHGARAFRIDPVNAECRFTVSTCRLSSVDLATAARTVCEAFVARGGAREAFPTLGAQAIWALVDEMSHALRPEAARYPAWIAARRIDASERRRMLARIEAMPHRPRLSVLMPTYRSDLHFLGRAIQSVRNQVYPDWELCIVDDGSDDAALSAFLEGQARADRRIVVALQDRNAGISAASNHALALATGDFVTFLDHDDELAPHALFAVAQAIVQSPDADMIYSDEDKIDAAGRRHDPFFKPDWTPEFFLGCMYTCHLSAYRRTLVTEVGGFRSAYDFAQDYDLALRVSSRACGIVHIPDVLYHWRTLPQSTASGAEAKPTAALAARAALQDHLDAAGMQGEVLPGPFAGSHRIKLAVIGEPLVSIVIPTAGKRITPSQERWFLLDLLRSIHTASTYRAFEIVLVDNADIEPALQRELDAFPVTCVSYRAQQFNYSEKVNLGVGAAKGDFVILLNDDMTIITPDWIEELIGWLQRPGIVATGAKLLFPDDTVQHAGVLLPGQGPSHAYYGAGDGDPGQGGGAVLVRNYSAVTAACLAVRRSDYEAVSGFDPAFRVNYNDVDFCLRLRRRGRIVYTPFAKLYHYESVSRDDSPPAELATFNAKWAEVVGYDPYYNPNLSQFAVYGLKRAA